MAERRVAAPEAGRAVLAVWRANAAAGLAFALVVIAACELFGSGGALARTGEVAAVLGLAIGSFLGLGILHFDLRDALRRLLGGGLRPLPAVLPARAAARVLGYPRRLARWMGGALLVVLPASVLAAAAWTGDPGRHVVPLLPAAFLAALAFSRAVPFVTRRALAPIVRALSPPSGAEAFRRTLAEATADMLVLPVTIAAIVGVVYDAAESERAIARAFSRAQQRAALALAGRPAVVRRLAAPPEADPGGSGAGFVSSCARAAGPTARRACGAVRAGPAGTAGFWIDERSGIGWAAAPAGTSGGDARGAAVVWAALPPPRGDPWLLGLLAGLLLLAHVAGAALGARAGREIRSVAGMLAEAARGGAGDPPAAAPSRFREVARLQEAAADVLARVGEVRSAEGQALREAEESHRLHTQFLATVSHDLKGPLNAVLGFSELLLQGAEGPLMPKQREDVRLIYRAGEELLAVVTAILDTAKIQAGRIELQREWVAPVELVSAAQGHGRSLAGAKEVLVLSEVQAGLAPVLVDRHRLGQALAAVIANAVKFTERGVVRIRAFVDDAPPDLRRRSLRIDVSDQGPGIAERDRSRIFRAFEQIDSTATRSQGGPGLGLFIARAMVESHGGRIWYETEVGRGSTFSIALPLGEEAVPPSA